MSLRHSANIEREYREANRDIRRDEACKGPPGFTLIEMLIALTILGLASAVVGLAVPEWRARSTLRETGAGLERLLQHARDAALRQQRPVLVRFEPDTRRIGAPVLDRWQSIPDGFNVTLTGAAIDPGGNTPAVLFLGDGSSTGGILAIDRGSNRLTIRILWLTGQIAPEAVQ